MGGATRSFGVVASMPHRLAHSCIDLYSGLMCRQVYLWFFVRYESNSVMQHGVILLAAMGHDATQRGQNILGKAYGVVYSLLPAWPASILQPSDRNNMVNGNKQIVDAAASARCDGYSSQLHGLLCQPAEHSNTQHNRADPCM